MRSPVIAFGIFAATVSPSLIAAAPTSPSLPGAGAVTGSAGTLPAPNANSVPSVPGAPGGFFHNLIPHPKRANDAGTAGGNARTGNTSTASGGSVVNNADDTTTLTSDDSSKSLLSYGSHLLNFLL